MESALRIARLTLFAAAVTAMYAGAGAATLYKSVDSNGRVTFSDNPVDGSVTVQRIESSESAKPAEGANAPVYLALADTFDEVVAQANAKVDMAEHALAVARSELGEHNPLSLVGTRLSRDQAQRVEFFKRDVTSARRDLMRVLKQRNSLYSGQRPLA